MRFGIHDFLNAQPLLVPLKRRAADAGLEIVTDVPSALADRLKSGELDVALIPSVEYLRAGGQYDLIPAMCIASRGPVGTVLLFSRVPLEQVRSIALDRRSRTSVALMHLLFAGHLKPGVSLHTASPDPQAMLRDHDAGLLIGDPALGWSPPEGVRVHDLSEEWFRLTRCTFVHAVVCAGTKVPGDAPIRQVLDEAREEGLKQIDGIAADCARRDGREPGLYLDYLKHRIRYRFGAEEREGLIRFRDLCLHHRLIPNAFDLEF